MREEGDHLSTLFVRFLPIPLLVLLVFSFIVLEAQQTALGYFFDAIRLLFVVLFALVTLLEKERIIRWRSRLQIILIVAIVFFTFGAGILNKVSLASASPYREDYHDGAWQTESAYQFLREGKNPYAVSYRDTFLGTYMSYIAGINGPVFNPAVEHYIYLPGTFLIAGIFESFEKTIQQAQDIRILLLLCYAGACWIFWKILPRHPIRIPLFILFACNPLLVRPMLEGRNDMLSFFFIIASVALLIKKQYLFSGLLLGVALATKQWAWFVYPFLLLQIWSICKEDKKSFYAFFISSLGVAGAIILPFFVWNPHAFFDDTVLYAMGLSQGANYPLAGYGFSRIVGLFGSQFERFPFWILEAVAGIPLLVYFFRRILSSTKVSVALMGGSVFLFVVLFFSKFFNDNYVAFIATLFLLWTAVYLSEQTHPLTGSNAKA